MNRNFPKSARLLTRQDFFFRPFHKLEGQYFRFIFTPQGKSRLGISISRKVLKHSTRRNRIRRLLKECFRQEAGRLVGYDLHVIGAKGLKPVADQLNLSHVEKEFESLFKHLRRRTSADGIS